MRDCIMLSSQLYVLFELLRFLLLAYFDFVSCVNVENMTEMSVTPCRDCRNLVFLVKFPSILQIMLWQQSFHLYLFRSKTRNLRLSCMLVITGFSNALYLCHHTLTFFYNINISHHKQSYLISFVLRP